MSLESEQCFMGIAEIAVQKSGYEGTSVRWSPYISLGLDKDPPDVLFPTLSLSYSIWLPSHVEPCLPPQICCSRLCSGVWCSVEATVTLSAGGLVRVGLGLGLGPRVMRVLTRLGVSKDSLISSLYMPVKVSPLWPGSMVSADCRLGSTVTSGPFGKFHSLLKVQSDHAFRTTATLPI